jgi:hypothetical protein
MTYLAKCNLVILPEVQGAVTLLYVGRFLIFQKILKALFILFLQAFITNLVLTKSSGPKCHAVAFTSRIFAGSLCHTDISGRRK